MKVITTTILLLVVFVCFPPKNKLISFVDDHMGQKIGDGCCKDLPINALGVTHQWMSDHMGDSVFREQHYVDRNHFQPGDLIIYYNPINKLGEETGDYHIGIIYKTINDSTTVIAEQNHYLYGDEPDSIVMCNGDSTYVCNSSRIVLSTINLLDYPVKKETKQNHISFYRI